MKILKIILIILTLINLQGCTKYEYDNEKYDSRIIIEKININLEYTISSIKLDVKNVVMFEEYGRPDIKNSNTIIGAHSGTGKEALFNDLHLLTSFDKIYIYYNNKKYTYIVREIKEVKETDTYILDNVNKSILTLLTCKQGDNTKRIVVICDMLIGKN